MTIESVSKKFKISVRDIKRMAKENLISDPLTDEDMSNIAFLAHFWGKEFWVKRQLARKPMKKRMNIINTAGMSKVESYIFNRYLNAHSSNGKRISVKQLAYELNRTYHVPNNKHLKEIILKTRKKAENKIRYQQSLSKLPE